MCLSLFSRNLVILAVALWVVCILIISAMLIYKFVKGNSQLRYPRLTWLYLIFYSGSDLEHAFPKVILVFFYTSHCYFTLSNTLCVGYSDGCRDFCRLVRHVISILSKSSSFWWSICSFSMTIGLWGVWRFATFMIVVSCAKYAPAFHVQLI